MKILFPPLTVILALAASALQAQVPQLLEYDGYLLENGKPVSGNRTLAVRLHSARSGGSVLYREIIGTLRVANGEFYFQYGQNGTAGNGTAPTGIIPALTGNQHWLSITVNGTEQSPRERLLSVPFALRSADAQKTDADLRKVVDAVGRVVVALGGNSTDLLINPERTVATIRKTADDLLELRKRAEVIPLSGGNLTAEANRTYSLLGDSRVSLVLPRNPKPGDSVCVLGAGVTIEAPSDSLIIHGWNPLEIGIPGIGELFPQDPSSGARVLGSDDALTLYMIASDDIQTQAYLVRSMNAGRTWSSIQKLNGSDDLIECSSDGSRLIYRTDSDSGDEIRLSTRFGNQTKALSGPPGSSGMDRVFMSRSGTRIYWIAPNPTSGIGQLYWTVNDGTSWQAANQTLSGKVFDFGSPSMWGGMQMSTDGRILLKDGTFKDSAESDLFISVDFGKNWRRLSLPIDQETSKNVELSFFLLSSDGSTIFLLSGNQIPLKRYLSKDQGKTWTASNLLYFPGGPEAPSIDFDKPLASRNLSQIYWGHYLSTDFGRRWQKVNMPDESTYAESRFIFVSGDAQRKIASYDSTEFRPAISWTHSIVSTQSTKMVYVGSGNWVVK